MKKLIFLFFLISLLSQQVFATIVEASNPNYAGKTLIFSRYTDPVTSQAEPLFSLSFDNAGKAKANVDISEVVFVFSDFGVYRGMFFAEPGKTVELQLPPLREKSFADQKNPFFKPLSFWFNSSSELNKKISSFDSKFNQLTNQYFNELYFQQSKSKYDTVVHMLNMEFPVKGNGVFENHKKLKIKILESDVFRLKTENVSPFLASIKQNYWTTPAFMELFDKNFSNKLSFDAKKIKGSELKKAIAENNMNFLLNHVKTKYGLNGSIAELAALKMLHDGFYSGDFSKSSILSLLESETLAKSNDKMIREITKNVSKKLKFLLPGSQAPVICLPNIDGIQKCSNENKDKFKYLVFADAEMMVCREQLKYLVNIQKQFQKYLEIILVMRKTDLIEMKMFLVKNEIPGIKLIDENGKYIQQYRVRSFPTCLLLDENHNVIFSEAKAPLDGFEQQFGTYLRNELFERQRNQSR
ncbi:MAG TPA: redoxin domain-containing protein [Draconibacterium sp.]|nr:redoxin domain-containing protein [Draconibacterium sp.]